MCVYLYMLNKYTQYIYIYQTLLSKATYTAFRLYIFCPYMCFLGIEPTTFALLTQCSNHWATGTQVYTEPQYTHIHYANKNFYVGYD